jgi:hypothetical protein
LCPSRRFPQGSPIWSPKLRSRDVPSNGAAKWVPKEVPQVLPQWSTVKSVHDGGPQRSPNRGPQVWVPYRGPPTGIAKGPQGASTVGVARGGYHGGHPSGIRQGASTNGDTTTDA